MLPEWQQRDHRGCLLFLFLLLQAAALGEHQAGAVEAVVLLRLAVGVGEEEAAAAWSVGGSATAAQSMSL